MRLRCRVLALLTPQNGGMGERGGKGLGVPSTPTTGLRERGNDSSRSTGHSGRQKAATRRNMRSEERVTAQGPVKKQQPDGMSHRGRGGVAQGLGIRLFAFGGAHWPLATAHSDPPCARTCFGRVNTWGGGGGLCLYTGAPFQTTPAVKRLEGCSTELSCAFRALLRIPTSCTPPPPRGLMPNPLPPPPHGDGIGQNGAPEARAVGEARDGGP